MAPPRKLLPVRATTDRTSALIGSRGKTLASRAFTSWYLVDEETATCAPKAAEVSPVGARSTSGRLPVTRSRKPTRPLVTLEPTMEDATPMAPNLTPLTRKAALRSMGLKGPCWRKLAGRRLRKLAATPMWRTGSPTAATGDRVSVSATLVTVMSARSQSTKSASARRREPRSCISARNMVARPTTTSTPSTEPRRGLAMSRSRTYAL
mmetsp:Transcript_29624/g.79521  ORF Transcript_29624/g.79521 Transcript_29624/m.79521 type:complete len:208 (-) Transcript_29624:489-1112(-)